MVDCEVRAYLASHNDHVITSDKRRDRPVIEHSEAEYQLLLLIRIRLI